MLNVGIIGASGYTGLELVKILSRHPQAHFCFATSRTHAGKTLAELYPGAPKVHLADSREVAFDLVDLIFLCLPHAASATTAKQALEAGVRVVDLSADFRLQDALCYQSWYGVEHPCPYLLAEAVYGLTEIARSELPSARLVANPGCYPTGILLALFPLLNVEAVAEKVIIDSKSGVSGAGRTPKQDTHFVEVAGNLKPYKIGRTHRHLPEIDQALKWWSASPPEVIFSPHLLPVSRGILSTLYIPVRPGWTDVKLHELYLQTYAEDPFIEILPLGESATLAHVVHSNRCALGLHYTSGTLIVTSAIDNLLKGASGQAVQNMNCMFGFDEISGLL
jgi:N-acetyl-gamma-glutamyl-phosphate reductase